MLVVPVLVVLVLVVLPQERGRTRNLQASEVVVAHGLVLVPPGLPPWLGR